jgi:hypothetical protein
LLNSIITSKTNSIVKISASIFEENFSFGRGSIAFADNFNSELNIENSLITNNYAIKGGVAYSHLEGRILISNCTI